MRCSIPVSCGKTLYAAVDLVLNSFYNVFNVHNKMYHSLDKVAQDVTHAADTACLLNPQYRHAFRC